jgi:hypothetical protein
VVGRRGYSYTGTAGTTTMPGPICQALCKPHFSLVTWLVFAMVSSSCLVLSAFVLHWYLCATFTDQSSANELSQLGYREGGYVR